MFNDSAVLFDSFTRQWLLFQNPVQVISSDDSRQVCSVLEEVEKRVDEERLYAVGFLSYEASHGLDPAIPNHSSNEFPLIWFAFYEPSRVSPFKMPFNKCRADLPEMNLELDRKDYAKNFDKIKDYIKKGDVYQVNYSFPLKAVSQTAPIDLFGKLYMEQKSSFAAFIQTKDWAICSASPELFFRLEGDRLISRPMKGTHSRGRWQAEDRTSRKKLFDSAKDRAENVMIVDMVRNDMGKLAKINSVEVTRLFHLEAYPTLWQMTSQIECKTCKSITEIFKAMFPAASITGAPKVRASEIIYELEGYPRGIYTGSIGFLKPERRGQFNVAIRTLQLNLREQKAAYRIGSGVVWNSKEETEWNECRLKAKILSQSRDEFSLLESILWRPEEGLFLFSRHIQRLLGSARLFGFDYDKNSLRKKLSKVLKCLPEKEHKVRLILSQDGKFKVQAETLQPLPVPYLLKLAGSPICSQNKLLYHKTTKRGLYEQKLREVSGCDDVLLWNEKEELTESCIANVACKMGGNLYTPPVLSGLLPGVYRDFLLKNKKLRERIILKEELKKIERIYLMNSVRGIWEVKNFDFFCSID